MCYSDDDKGTSVYQLFNPYETTSTHLYTTDANEYAQNQLQGWVPNGICWYGLAE